MSDWNPVDALARVRKEFGEHGGVNMSLSTSTTFTVLEAEVMPDIFAGQRGPEHGGCYLYARHYNPTVYALGRQLAALEGSEFAYGTASGMSAIATSVMQLCDAGDHIVSSNTVYGGTHTLFKEYFPKKNTITTSFVDIADLDTVTAAIQSNTKVLYTETLSNPTLVLANIPKLAAIAKEHKLTLVVDNTFCPLSISPIQLGADIVVHSLTKFIGGGSDCIAGAICCSREFIEELLDLHTGSLMLVGPTMDPRAAFQISQRIPHLALRMKAHSEYAQTIAERLADRGLNVVYPGLPAHPQHQLYRELYNAEFGFGGLFCLDVGSSKTAYQLMDNLQNEKSFGFMAVSLGYYETLMSCSASSTSSEISEEDQEAAGISPGLIRFSIGYTGSIEERWKQLEAALTEVDL